MILALGDDTLGNEVKLPLDLVDIWVLTMTIEVTFTFRREVKSAAVFFTRREIVDVVLIVFVIIIIVVLVSIGIGVGLILLIIVLVAILVFILIVFVEGA